MLSTPPGACHATATAVAVGYIYGEEAAVHWQSAGRATCTMEQGGKLGKLK